MMRIQVVAIFLAVTDCEINKANTVKDILEYWKPDKKFNVKLSSKVHKENGTTKRVWQPAIYRHHGVKHLKGKNEGSSKWPKILRQRTIKSAPRVTKLHMMQDGDNKTAMPLESTENDAVQYLSSYSIKQQLESIAQKIPHANVTVEVIGRTVEYQDIVLLKITKEKFMGGAYFRADDEKYADDAPEKKIIFIVHGLSVMGAKHLFCLSYEEQFLKLVSYYVNHLDNFDIFLIPMANPDGYAMVKYHQLFSYIWNKNAAPQSECQGVALDRNFDVAWSSNLSLSSCSQEYPGVTPFSEAETRAIRNIFHKYSHKIVAYLNVHAGTYDPTTFKGDAVLYPKGYTDSVTDEDKYIDMKAEIDEAIRNASFQVISVAVETLHSWYGRVTGSSVDYASTVYGIPFALELVMQLYSDDMIDGKHVDYNEIALTEVWGRVIDVIFKYIWKNLNEGNEVR